MGSTAATARPKSQREGSGPQQVVALPGVPALHQQCLGVRQLLGWAGAGYYASGDWGGGGLDRPSHRTAPCAKKISCASLESLENPFWALKKGTNDAVLHNSFEKSVKTYNKSCIIPGTKRRKTFGVSCGTNFFADPPSSLKQGGRGGGPRPPPPPPAKTTTHLTPWAPGSGPRGAHALPCCSSTSRGGPCSVRSAEGSAVAAGRSVGGGPTTVCGQGCTGRAGGGGEGWNQASGTHWEPGWGGIHPPPMGVSGIPVQPGMWAFRGLTESVAARQYEANVRPGGALKVSHPK